MHNELNWTWQSTAQDKAKLPNKWEDHCLDLAHNLAWNILQYNIPPKLIINSNQTGVYYLGTGAKTWEIQGSSQVSGVGKEEKQQLMLMAAVTAAGQILPYQAIYKGQTAVSLPLVQACLLCEAYKFVFISGGNKHWSTLDTMMILLCIEWLAETTKKHLCQGVKPKNIAMDSTPATLCNASVGWITDSWEWLQDHLQVILDAWCWAELKGQNLSYDFLTSPANQTTVCYQFFDDWEFALLVINTCLTGKNSKFKEEDDTPDCENDYSVHPLVLA
ncbi:hypothetical protein RhiTH_010468 [Rhizoctonia solani]